MARISFPLLVWLAMFLGGVMPVRGSETGQFHGLFVGIDNFQDGDIRSLRCGAGDAQALYDLYTNPDYLPLPHGRITLLKDTEASVERVESALGELAQEAKPEDTVLVYFASHGMQLNDQRTFWVLYDTQLTMPSGATDTLGLDEATALESGQLREAFSRISARRFVVLVDCCFSAASVLDLKRVRGGKQDVALLPKVHNPFEHFKGDGRVIITATTGEQQGMEMYAEGHGAFTYYLLEGLRGGADSQRDNVVEVWEAWQYLRDRVTAASEKVGGYQQPTLSAQAMTHGFPMSTYPVSDQSAVQPAGSSRQAEQAGTVPEWVLIELQDGFAFEVSPTEITNEQFLSFVQSNPAWRRDNIVRDYHDGDYLNHWPAADRYPDGQGQYPVRYVSWFAAKAFAEWVGGRLPYEQAWQLAAAGPGQHLLFPWGEEWQASLCNCDGMLQPAIANPEGGAHWPAGILYQVIGNVAEWCQDWRYEAAGPAAVSRAVVVQPVEQASEVMMTRVIKGGSFRSGMLGCNLESVIYADPVLCSEDVGFRVMR